MKVTKIFVAWIARLLLSLRYSVQIPPLTKLKDRRSTLLLANHPALVDPIIVCAYLYPYLFLRPLMLERFYRMPFVNGLMRWINAIAIPEIEGDSGPYKLQRLERGLADVKSALRAGDNVLIYPAGRLTSSGHERLRGNTAVQSILADVLEAKVVLLRTEGLFGSIFSRAVSGRRSPDFLQALLTGAKIILKNLIFFTPRRVVKITVQEAPPDFPRNGDVLTVNRWLEDWFNQDMVPEPVLVSHAFWANELPSLAKVEENTVELFEVSAEIKGKIAKKLRDLLGGQEIEFSFERKLSDDLGLDSLTIAELLLWLDEEFAVVDVELSELVTVGDLVKAAASGVVNGKLLEQDIATPPRWNEERGIGSSAVTIEEKIIPAAFLRCAEQKGGGVAIADQRGGRVLTWKQAKFKVILLALILKKLPGKQVGVLMPSSAASALCISALMLAQKVPVILNWTAGRRNIEHALQIADVQVVLSIEAFLDQVQVDLAFIEDKLRLLEKLVQPSLMQVLQAKLLSYFPVSRIMDYFNLNQLNDEETAVILFTSGSEAAPKGVPLSHRNILKNIIAGREVLELRGEDVIYSFLPPFHSFGLTVSTILPLVSGIRVVFAPNPNESRKLASGCKKWGVTIVAGTPTFLRSILASGPKDYFSSVRVFLSGAERAPELLFETVAELGNRAEVIEGYGITECSPIVCATPLGEKRNGVGRPLSSVELIIVNHETMQPLPEGERGLILIRGETVFSGYLGGIPDPFLNVAGKRWYNSGDLGYFENGCLVISGRLKRFVKIGGEMISLPAVEDALKKALQGASVPNEEQPAELCIIPKGEGEQGRPMLYLFTTLNLSPADANTILQEQGFPTLVRIQQTINLPELPLLGSGKVDLQKLKELLL